MRRKLMYDRVLNLFCGSPPGAVLKRRPHFSQFFNSLPPIRHILSHIQLPPKKDVPNSFTPPPPIILMYQTAKSLKLHIFIAIINFKHNIINLKSLRTKKCCGIFLIKKKFASTCGRPTSLALTPPPTIVTFCLTFFYSLSPYKQTLFMDAP